MSPNFNRIGRRDSYDEGAFLMRALNESTECTFRLRPQETFRPTLTIYHQDDIQTNRVSNELARYVERLDEKYIDQMTTASVVALMSTMIVIQRKAPLVNMAVKWIQKRNLESAELNALIQSIVVKNLSFDQVAVIRLAIHSYFNNPELKDYFDLHLNNNGFVNLRRKKTGPPGKFEEADKLRYETILSQVRTKFENPFFNRKKRLNWTRPQKYKEPRNTKNFQHHYYQKKIENLYHQSEFDEIKDKEEGKPKQLGFSGHPQFQNQDPNAKGAFGNFPTAECTDRQNQKKDPRKPTNSKVNWNESRPKSYSRRSHIGTVTAVGFPSLQPDDPESSDPEVLSVNLRDLTLSQREAKRTKFQKSISPKSRRKLFTLVETDEHMEEESAEKLVQKRTESIVSEGSSSGFVSSPSSSSFSSSSSFGSTSSSSDSWRVANVKVNDHSVGTSPSASNKPPTLPSDQLTDFLDSLMY